jgi:hypothetical protein
MIEQNVVSLGEIYQDVKNIPWFTSIIKLSKQALTNINQLRIGHDDKLLLTLVDKLFCYAI